MGFNRRYRFVYDAARYKADFVLECPRCRHRVIVERNTMLSILRALDINPWVPTAAGKLRCTKCRHRGGILEITSEGSPDAMRLGEGDSLPARGLRVSIGDWCRMDERERKRLRRMLR